MKIQVTQADIDTGVQKEACNCPVAQAVRRRLKPGLSAVCFLNISVVREIGAYAREQLYTTRTPHDVHQTMQDYDRTGRMEPFEFDVEIPEEYLVN